MTLLYARHSPVPLCQQQGIHRRSSSMRRILCIATIIFLFLLSACSRSKWVQSEPVPAFGHAPVEMHLLTADPPVYRNVSRHPEFFMSSMRECGIGTEDMLSIRSLFIGLQEVRVLDAETKQGTVFTRAMAIFEGEPIAFATFSRRKQDCQHDLVLWRFYEDETDREGFFLQSEAFATFAQHHFEVAHSKN